MLALDFSAVSKLLTQSSALCMVIHLGNETLAARVIIMCKRLNLIEATYHPMYVHVPRYHPCMVLGSESKISKSRSNHIPKSEKS